MPLVSRSYRLSSPSASAHLEILSFEILSFGMLGRQGRLDLLSTGVVGGQGRVNLSQRQVRVLVGDFFRRKSPFI